MPETLNGGNADVIRAARIGRETPPGPQFIGMANIAVPASGGSDVVERLSRLETHFEHMRADMTDIRSEMRSIRSTVDHVKWWVLGTGLASALAVFAGMGGIYLMMDQLHASWFNRYLEKSENAAAEREAATRERLDRLRAETQANLLREQELYERREKERREEFERRNREQNEEFERRNREQKEEFERRDRERKEEFNRLLERADSILSRLR